MGVDPLCAHIKKNEVIHRKVSSTSKVKMREIVHLQAGQCGNQIGAKVSNILFVFEHYIESFCFRNTVFFALAAGALCPYASQKPHPGNIRVSYFKIHGFERLI